MEQRDKYIEYTKEELEAMHTRAILAHLQDIRVYRSSTANHAGPRCCEICNEYIGSDEFWNEVIKPKLDEYSAYLTIIKSVLSTREHIPNKQEAKTIRKEKAKSKQNR